ncbi:hypothetical protein IC617_08385 [Neiella sp. HB171785]|uniref:Uncharacterized protein n=1 Tax=Neiella litorisoli TaxID=2771431 RepID=A0A8J6QIT0_9GAMM|nr:hypothetical protein [Neiella litorisoli]MBD1389442.1 hypothetical protein [Neiella litorisoli]
MAHKVNWCWVFIGEYLHQRLTDKLADEQDSFDFEQAICGMSATLFLKVTPKAAVLSGISGVYLQVPTNGQLHWRAERPKSVTDGQPSQSYGLGEHGFGESYRLAVHARAAWLGINLDELPAIKPPPRASVLAYIEQVRGREWLKRNTALVDRLLGD